MNILYLISFIFINFILITLSYKLFGKKGLLIYIILSVVAANIQVNKFVHYITIGNFSIDATLGNVMFGGIFLATDLISEKYGKDEANKIVKYSLFANISFIIVMIFGSLFISLNVDNTTTSYNNAYDLFFSLNGNVLKTILIGNAVYFISQSIDIFIFDKIKNKLPDDKYLFVRNNISTLLSQLIDTLLITFLFGIFGIFPFEFFLGVFISTFTIKIIVSLLDTPFLYIMKKINPIEE